MPKPGSSSSTVLGFDPGAKLIGVAVGEAVLGTARPLEVLSAQYGQPDWSKVAELISTWQPDCIVVGLPCHADGSDSSSTAQARQLASRLHDRFGLPVRTIDERLSSYEASTRLARRPRRQPSQWVHSEAAAVIIETYFAQEAA